MPFWTNPLLLPAGLCLAAAVAFGLGWWLARRGREGGRAAAAAGRGAVATEQPARQPRSEASGPRELRESDERYRRLIDQSPFGILFVDRQLDVVLANASYARLVGVTSVEELRGHNLRDSPALDDDSIRGIVPRVVAGENVVADLSYISAFGKQVDVRAHIAPVQNAEGEVTGGQLLFEDVSESRRLEARLREAQKMEAVGRLAGGIAHDFNNYLTAIVGWAEMLRDTAEEGEGRREAASQVLEAAKRSASLTQQLLALSRQQVLEPERIDLGDVVARLEALIQVIVGEKIAIERLREPDLPSIDADPSMIERVIVNLAVNARDAMPQGGRLRIETRASAAPGGGGVLLAVVDDGVGMDAETRRQVFEPFFTTKAAGHGTGLGLSTVYGMVRQCDAEIDIESAPGAGTTVRICFPKAEGPLPTKTAEIRLDPDAPLRGSETVLLAEDEGMVRSLARRVLAQNGYRVIEAEDGQRALEEARRAGEAIQLLLTDVRMPGLGGVELAAKLRAQMPGLRVLYMSAYTDTPYGGEGGLPEGADLLPKPFSGSVLLERVRGALDRA